MFCQCRKQVAHRIIDNRRRINDGRHTDRQHRDAERFPGERVPVIANTGAGVYAGVRDLNRTVEPSRTARRQRIHRNDKIRLCLCQNAPDDLTALHSGLRHHTRYNRTHLFLLFSKDIRAKFAHHMPRDKQMVDNLWSKRIRCHLTVAKPHHQRREMFPRR